MNNYQDSKDILLKTVFKATTIDFGSKSVITGYFVKIDEECIVCIYNTETNETPTNLVWHGDGFAFHDVCYIEAC